MNGLFLPYGTGSRPKANFRVRALNDPSSVSKAHIDEVINYGKRFGVDTAEPVEIVMSARRDGRKLNDQEKQAITEFNSLLNLKFEEIIGLAKRFDGEAFRPEMYAHVRDNLEGVVKSADAIRSTGEQSYYAGIVEGEINPSPSLVPLTVREFEFLKAHARGDIADIKIPLNGPYMMALMSLDRCYTNKLRREYGSDPAKLEYEVKRALTLAFAERVVRPQVLALANAGAKWIQLDEPSTTNDYEHTPLFVEGINAVVKGINGIQFSIHACYPNRKTFTGKNGYDLFFPHALSLDPSVDHFSLELANAGDYLGDLKPFAEIKGERRFEIGVGVTDIRPGTDIKEGMTSQDMDKLAEKIRLRLLSAAKAMGGTKGLYAAHDCGLRRLNRLDYSFALDEALVKGAELARRG